MAKSKQTPEQQNSLPQLQVPLDGLHKALYMVNMCVHRKGQHAGLKKWEAALYEACQAYVEKMNDKNRPFKVEKPEVVEWQNDWSGRHDF